MTATRLSGHLETLRPYDLVVAPVVTALGAVLAAPAVPPWRLLPAAALGLTACAGALYAADYLTRHEDARTKPHRPIPSGRLPAAAARRCAVLLWLAAFVLATLLAWRSLLFVGLAVLAQDAYGRCLKDRGLWGDVAVGFSGWSCPLLAGACCTAPWPPAHLTAPALLLGVQGTFGNLLLAADDRPHDLRAGCGTLPVRHGSGRAWAVLAALAVAEYAGAPLLPVRTGPRTAPVFLPLVLAGAATAAAVLVTVRRRPDRAVGLHMYERVLLPAALWALTGEGYAAVAVAAASAGVLRLTSRPMLRPGPYEEGGAVGA
ncbi:UbiA family prenyltransferase [Streptomyces sp. NPDC086777]|uniref:UbiA prenyltransferase family protein n=1 Tax=Streptomyces sp. NPDC086777 TaxID=3154866 RepID=UPI00344F2139